eukprot:CAMPEP_0201237210 /NCGR_PEP_ID=MMETSP0852-20130820/8516_1 /ASSEMBLY_ACC=CAM_ASM_000632 /TAXON_ID=183588 /ORGANISM="Pseudo-nitzschia fraudulenta, Strain WWA7" /LENGTH=178 /DNA_ID=CAMNT_0047531371 /DNA_START=64 /DNA_END=597 /DNA_ORIENTATION=+
MSSQSIVPSKETEIETPAEPTKPPTMEASFSAPDAGNRSILLSTQEILDLVVDGNSSSSSSNNSSNISRLSDGKDGFDPLLYSFRYHEGSSQASLDASLRRRASGSQWQHSIDLGNTPRDGRSMGVAKDNGSNRNKEGAAATSFRSKAVGKNPRPLSLKVPALGSGKPGTVASNGEIW